MKFTKRTHTCGELNINNENEISTLNGWVHVRRDFGSVIFIDLRDKFGITQLVFEESNQEVYKLASTLRSEYVISVTGVIRRRENPNKNIPTGLIEILVDKLELINKSELPPFEIASETEPNEDLRLKYRYLDLRRQKLQKNLKIRNKLYHTTHNFFFENGFTEIETPVLMKSTPEGARDFLVPSRINRGKFYALPQSPQIFKQILMISGYDRYMQIVKCFRDEDLRSDRQPEFTQIDIEMSFVDQDDIIALQEKFIQRVWKDIANINIELNFGRLSFKEAMSRFGSDKPDQRFGLELVSIKEAVSNSEFKVFADIIANGGEISAINAKGCAKYSRKQIDELTVLAKKYGAKGLAWIKIQDNELKSPISKFLSEEEINSIKTATNLENNDLLLISSDSWLRACTILGALRLEIANKEGILESVNNQYHFSWIIDFPLFEKDDDTGEHFAMHHPFTSPHHLDIDNLESDPYNCRAIAHDLVINGHEVGGGSIRIHNQEVQEKMFAALGLSKEEAEDKFGFLLDALKFGAPPHGGIAYGLDRLVMILAGNNNIRDVIAFPKTTTGSSLMENSPNIVDEKQLEDLGLKLINKS